MLIVAGVTALLVLLSPLLLDMLLTYLITKKAGGPVLKMHATGFLIYGIILAAVAGPRMFMLMDPQESFNALLIAFAGHLAGRSASYLYERRVVRLREFFDVSALNRSLLISNLLLILPLCALTYVSWKDAVRYTDASEPQAAEKRAQALCQGILIFKVHTGKLPAQENGFRELLENISGDPRWRGPYIEENALKGPGGGRFRFLSGPDGPVIAAPLRNGKEIHIPCGG